MLTLALIIFYIGVAAIVTLLLLFAVTLADFVHELATGRPWLGDGS